MKGREGKKKGRDGAINRAEIEREMDAIKIQVSSFSFEIRPYESKHFDFLRRRNSKELFHLSSVICGYSSETKKKIMESKFILPNLTLQT